MYNNLKSFLQNNKWMLICHIFMTIAGIIVLSLFDKFQILIFVNSLHTLFLDFLMYHLTRIPELAIVLFTFVLSFLFEKRIFLAVIISFLIASLIIFSLKFMVFSDIKRPLEWISKNAHIQLHFNPNIKLHLNSSFPSGHTFAAFCSMTCLALITKNGWLQFFFFLAAFAMGISRVYVLQHYFLDVFFGAQIGFWVAFLVHFYITRNLTTPKWRQPILNIFN